MLILYGGWAGLVLFLAYIGPCVANPVSDKNPPPELELVPWKLTKNISNPMFTSPPTRFSFKGRDWLGSKAFYTNFDDFGGLSFFEAIEYCLEFGLEPAQVTNPQQDKLFNRLLKYLGQTNWGNRPFWLAFNDIQEEGVFSWPFLTYPSSTYVNWAQGSPSWNINLNCVSAQQLAYPGQDFGWINLPCSTRWRALCQE